MPYFRDVDSQPFVQKCNGLRLRSTVGEHGSGVGQHHVLGVLHQAIVFGVEDVVDGRQADILVCTAVTGDKVGVKQLVVILTIGRRLVRIAEPDF